MLVKNLKNLRKEVGKRKVTKALLNVQEVCEYLGIGKTKARELLLSPESNFTVRIDKRIFAHKELLDKWLLGKVGN